MMPNPKRILIIDSQPVYRTGLKTVIEAGGKYSVINEAGTGRQGLRLAEQLQPDIVILDTELPDTDGVRLTREIRRKLKNTRVMILSRRSGISDLHPGIAGRRIRIYAERRRSRRHSEVP